MDKEELPVDFINQIFFQGLMGMVGIYQRFH
jgi:hypothetical protein